jgi:hypothetical protein
VILDRIELADISGPKRLASKLHEQIGVITGPVPIEEIARALDIVDIKVERFDGFEGMLLTDAARRQGAILANRKGGERRARFTIAHELGHFLLERHVLSDAKGFRCRAPDMREDRVDTQRTRQETQANQFAAEVLCPKPIAMCYMTGDPDLRDAVRMRDELDISLEATVRRMIDLRPEPLSAVWSHEGQVRYVCSGGEFPYVICRPKSRLPQDAPAARAVARGQKCLTPVEDALPHTWTDRPGVAIREQTRVGANGYAVTLLQFGDEDHDDGGGDDELLPELDTPGFR